MAFPGPNAHVYYNDAGEPLGWDYPSDEPYEMDPEEQDRLEQKYQAEFYNKHGFDIEDACVQCFNRQAMILTRNNKDFICDECNDFNKAKEELLHSFRTGELI